MKPFQRDQWDFHIVSMTPLRQRRLLQMARNPRHSHKQFYGQFLFLMWDGLVQWTLGTAFLTEAGEVRLAQLIEEGV